MVLAKFEKGVKEMKKLFEPVMHVMIRKACVH